MKFKEKDLAKLCDTTYLPAYHSSGHRRPSDITTGVIHCTEADTAQSSATYFKSASAGGSAHLVIDDKHCYRCLDDLVVPWAAPPLNQEGYHIEQAGFSNWTTRIWMEHEETIARTAYKMALRCKRFKIPAVWLTVNDLKRGTLHGITSHNNISLAFGKSDHTDPGKGYPIEVFMEYLRKFAK